MSSEELYRFPFEAKGWIEEHLIVLIVGAAVALALAAIISQLMRKLSEKYGGALAYLIPLWIIKGLAVVVVGAVILAARPFGKRWRIPKLFGRRRVREPEATELIERKAVNPVRTPRIQHLDHGAHYTPAGVIEGVHMATIAESGAAKGQSVVNYQIQFQLEYSPEHLIVLEAKPNEELSDIVRAHYRPEDRVFVYTMQPQYPGSSALYIPTGRELEDVAESICKEPGTKDPHWNGKAAEVIPASGQALEAEEWPANLGEIASAVGDRETLEALRNEYRVVDNVADEDKEWGYIRSTAKRHLKPLSDERVARVFAGGPDTPQPTFGANPNGGRDIVIVQPHAASAEREARYIVAALDILLQRAAQGGYAGGPGTYAVLDEFASFLDLSKMRYYLDMGRGGNLQISYVLQGRDQLAAAVGKIEADSIIESTEIKCVGATSDVELAKTISELSGKSRVDYQAARQRGELLSDYREESTPNVRPTEITGQGAGEWTVVHRGRVYKRYIPPEHYHHTQAKEPKTVKPAGVPKRRAKG